MSFLLVANIGRRDFGWFPGVFVLGGGSLGFCGGGLVFSYVAKLSCAVYRRWVFPTASRPSFPSLPLPSSSLRSLQAFFGSSVLRQ
jgi:hypothetical protein